MKNKFIVHPYMPNSVPETKKEMLNALKVEKVEDLYKDVIPKHLRFKGEMRLPDPIFSEYELKKHVEKILSKNISSSDYISFLGAGCYQHYVPAVCDEINSRSEFLTAYCGDTYSDHGKMQAIFEYCSMMAELVDMDVVSYTNYDGGQASSSSIRMALRITGRREVILPKIMHPEILSQVRDYCKHVADIKFVDYDPVTGQTDLKDLKNKISEKTAAIYLENPSYIGILEEHGQEIADMAHEHGALFIVSADPSSLGILESPANYGADIVCGDIQPLGMHMHYGGGCAGYIATPQEKKLVQEIPTYLYGITLTKVEGEYGWGRALNERCSHGSREDANEYFGTECGLWAITAGVYLALMGPRGMEELGETIIYRANYAKNLLSKIDGVKAGIFDSNHFKEFVVNFDETGKTIDEINKRLLDYGIFGGKDLSKDFPELGNSALYCVTEIIGIDEIKKLVAALKEIV
ncbi:aminomethyl-transferring glycine dehydrogenase subunit GcvPA [Alkaliphilus peptidifermentans]|uniref:Glycine dehydrogenase subunit 1 n=1 Tax=Alkaliphilus peptidifermentans DSM 18978 TaxID=1120976 RepID=A0A1G5BJG7_9FIRM|nr:aminomethyl-transferring glycine dehydrogenase subunit GcvPA [Alkaliphilus peptidifermentans]SCX90227.1 glycine dehydrogenase subunit 1 [Alkaliphilus peptidifermentans DSM 18978]